MDQVDAASARFVHSPAMTYRLAVIGGDGVGPEVTDQALKAIRAAGARFGFEISPDDYDLGGRRFLTTGEVLPASVQDELSQHDAILLGAVGTPDVPPGVLETGTSPQAEVRLRPLHQPAAGQALSGRPDPDRRSHPGPLRSGGDPREHRRPLRRRRRNRPSRNSPRDRHPGIDQHPVRSRAGLSVRLRAGR